VRIARAADHAGFQLKEVIRRHLQASGHEVVDLGTYSAEPVDYPAFGAAVGREVVSGRAELGVAACGTGMGIAMAANKVPGVRAAVVTDVTTARLARRHNDANVICFGGRVTAPLVATEALDAFLSAAPEGGRHRRRVEALGALDGSLGASSAPGEWFWDWLGSDPELAALVRREVERQSRSLQLIASENFASLAVLAAAGSPLTNKYAEGYPRRRYYGGNAVIDEVEELARVRATALFGADHANVQPHAGAMANLAVYQALLEPGDTVLAMRLDQGGHLTHGSPASITSRFWRFVYYGVTPASDDPDQPGERIDFDEVAAVAERERPRLIVAGATAYPRVLEAEPFRRIADAVDALLMFDVAHPAGLIAGRAHPNPVPFADVVTFTTHKTLRGPRGGAILCRGELAQAVDKAVFPGLQGGPLEHVIAAKAVAFGEAATEAFRGYAAQVVANARALGAALAEQGFRLVSGGTDNHLLLVDLRSFDPELTGKEAQDVLDRAGITLNRNQVPNDPRPPFVTSGLRLGTAAETTAGMREPEMLRIAELIGTVLRCRHDAATVERVAAQVAELTSAFPPYPELLGLVGRARRSVRRASAASPSAASAEDGADPADGRVAPVMDAGDGVGGDAAQEPVGVVVDAKAEDADQRGTTRYPGRGPSASGRPGERS
jgi:glycine hydroxymethyltransferase